MLHDVSDLPGEGWAIARYHLLLVEDDAFVLGLLSAVLENEGFITTRVGTAREALVEADRRAFSAILLDLGLPDEEGLAVLRKLRSRNAAPILVVTARQDVDDRIGALELGAEDFVVKPVEPRELVLRLRRLIGSAPPSAERIERAGWVLDLAARSLASPDGRPVALRRAEFNLLARLFASPDRVFSRGQLLDAISTGDDAPSERAVDVLVSRLRSRLAPDGRRIIVTVPGVGYKLERQGAG